MSYKSNFERSCCYYISNKMNDLRIRMNTSVTVYSSFSCCVSQWHTTNAPNYHRQLQHWCYNAISSILCSPNPYVLRTIIRKKYIYVFPLLLNKKHRKRDEGLTINRRLRLQSSNEESCRQLKQPISNCSPLKIVASLQRKATFLGRGAKGKRGTRGWQKQQGWRKNSTSPQNLHLFKPLWRAVTISESQNG